MIKSFIEDTAAFRPVIEQELKSGALYIGIAKAIESRNEKLATKKATALVSIGSDAILSIIQQIENAVVKSD
jgi:hypothetical protein